PTTANYIVVASLMANVVVTLGAQNGLVVPLIAVHLFVFYFGIMADVTPPVGLASFAAAAISGSDPIKTGLQAFAYSIRTAILPFFFIFNTDMLLIGVKSWWEGAFIFVEATAAILLFSAAMQGYFLVRSKLWESAALLFVAVSIFAPQLWIDLAQPPYKDTKVSNLMAVLEEAKKDDLIRVRFEDPSGESELRTFIPITNDSHDAMAILEEFGLVLEPHGKSFIVSDVLFNSAAEKAGIDFDYVVSRVRVPREQMNKRLVLAPAAVLFLVVFGAQLSRRRSRAALATIS
ncbi:MAG: DUF3394 domain-containing protein, partial [Rickettsiales bacterium]|nr:DUF3394 domain-containing protein [Rickettsiales bacterium]